MWWALIYNGLYFVEMAIMTRTAFVAGATGYTGRAVVTQLIGRGVRAVAHVRPDSAARHEWTTRFEQVGATVDTTPWEPQAIAQTLARLSPAYVFALLGTTRKRTRREAGRGVDSSYEAVDYGLTALLMDATRRAAPQARFIYLSSIGVTGPSANPYLDVRWRVESELKDSGLDYVIAQPSFITGADREERRPTERITAVLADGLLGVLGAVGARTLRDRYASLTGTQLGAALVAAALDPALGKRTLDAAQLRRLAAQ